MHLSAPEPRSLRPEDTLFVLWHPKLQVHFHHTRAEVERWRATCREEVQTAEQLQLLLRPAEAEAATRRAGEYRRLLAKWERVLAAHPTPGNRVFA